MEIKCEMTDLSEEKIDSNFIKTEFDSNDASIGDVYIKKEIEDSDINDSNYSQPEEKEYFGTSVCKSENNGKVKSESNEPFVTIVDVKALTGTQGP